MSLELEKPGREKIKSSLPASVRMNPINARILHRNSSPSIRNGDCKPFAFLYRHHCRRQLQKVDNKGIIRVTTTSICRRIRDECPQHVIACLGLLLASGQRQCLD